MADEPQFKDEIQGVFSDGEGNVFYDSWAEANGKPPLKKLSDMLTMEQLMEKLDREFPDKPEDADEAKPEADKPA